MASQIIAGLPIGIAIGIIAIVALSWLLGQPAKSSSYKSWYKIEMFVSSCNGDEWHHVLYNGKLSCFYSLTSAASALMDRKQYPTTIDNYRIVQVTEQVVSSTGELL